MFPGGVEFDWYGTDGDPPTFCFYFSKEQPTTTLKIIRIPMTQVLGLFVVTISVNGREMKALLDTGSPITVLTDDVANEARWEPVEEIDGISELRDHHRLRVGGVDGRPMEVMRSTSSDIAIRVGDVSLGRGPVYLGSIPALSILRGLVREIDRDTETPVAILGLDFSRRSYRMVVLAKPCELWLEELNDSKGIYSSFGRKALNNK